VSSYEDVIIRTSFVLVVEHDYLPDSEVFVFSRVYTP
jgi:hypothetical protein